jgi:hypothetical protein
MFALSKRGSEFTQINPQQTRASDHTGWKLKRFGDLVRHSNHAQFGGESGFAAVRTVFDGDANVRPELEA